MCCGGVDGHQCVSRNMAAEETFGEVLLSNLSRALGKVEEIISQVYHHNSEEYNTNVLLIIDLINQLVAIVRKEATLSTHLPEDIKALNDLAESFEVVNRHLCSNCTDSTTLICFPRLIEAPRIKNARGRPKFEIPQICLEELRCLGFSWSKISRAFGVSRWTIYRRLEEYNLQNLLRFSDVSDEEIDEMVLDYMSRHGETTGEPYVSGYLRSKGLLVQRRRVRASLNRIDPANTALRWGTLITCRTYYVPWPNSLWHIDGHHSLIRWKFVIHGCIDGKSRKIMFLKANTNNLAETVLCLFLNAIAFEGGLWPSRIRVDYGVENVMVCDAMIEKRGPGRGSYIAGSSTRNQRIERLWRDVFRCVAVIFYYSFYGMEQSGMLDIEDPVCMFALHLALLPRINFALNEFKESYNNHRLRTERNWTPNQIWINGILNSDNPLANDLLDDAVEDIDFYGMDQEVNSCFEDSPNDVVVSPDPVFMGDEIAQFVNQTIDVNRDSTQMGIDIYEEVLQQVIVKLQHYNLQIS